MKAIFLKSILSLICAMVCVLAFTLKAKAKELRNIPCVDMTVDPEVHFTNINFKETKRMVLPDKVQDEFVSLDFLNTIRPTEASQNDEEGQAVISKMGDKSLSYMWNNSALKETSVARAAETVEKKINVEANYTDEENVQHKVSFKVLAMQALAKLEYKGLVKAVLNFDMKSFKTQAEIVEQITEGNNLIISHTITNDDQKSALSLRWDL
ncbi:MAG: hypothetical protein ACK41T_06185 [Pseudobdellovibrio sp.]